MTAKTAILPGLQFTHTAMIAGNDNANMVIVSRRPANAILGIQGAHAVLQRLPSLRLIGNDDHIFFVDRDCQRLPDGQRVNIVTSPRIHAGCQYLPILQPDHHNGGFALIDKFGNVTVKLDFICGIFGFQRL